MTGWFSHHFSETVPPLSSKFGSKQKKIWIQIFQKTKVKFGEKTDSLQRRHNHEMIRKNKSLINPPVNVKSRRYWIWRPICRGREKLKNFPIMQDSQGVGV